MSPKAIPSEALSRPPGDQDASWLARYATSNLASACATPGTARQWSDEAILEALRRLQDELGRPLSARYLYRLRSGRKGAAGAFPSYKTVLDRFGSWRRVSELLGPPRIPADAGGRIARRGG